MCDSRAPGASFDASNNVFLSFLQFGNIYISCFVSMKRFFSKRETKKILQIMNFRQKNRKELMYRVGGWLRHVYRDCMAILVTILVGGRAYIYRYYFYILVKLFDFGLCIVYIYGRDTVTDMDEIRGTKYQERYK